MTDEEIDENFKEWEKEQLLEASIEHFKEKISEFGPTDKYLKPSIEWNKEENNDGY